MKRIAMAIIFSASLILSGCSDSEGATRILQQNGYINIHTTGYSFMMCGKDDAFSTGFTATSSSGRNVEGAVCSSWFTGYTIRFK